MKPARLLTGFGWTVVFLLGSVVALVVAVLHAAPGQRVALRLALAQVERQLNGTVEVRGIRARTLLRGFTLEGISVTGVDGRPVFEADSLRLGYRLWGLLNRDALLAPVEIWNPTFEFETSPARGSNLERLLTLPTPRVPRPQGSESPGFRVELSRVVIHNGTVRLKLPFDGDPRPGLSLEASSEGPLRVIELRSLHARVRRARLLDPKAPGEIVDIDDLSVDVYGLDSPLLLRKVSGSLERAGTRVEGRGLTLELPGSRITGSADLEWGGGDGTMIALDLQVPRFMAQDFAWLDPRIPELTGRFALRLAGPLSALSVDLDNLDLALDEARLRGRVGLEVGAAEGETPGVRFANTRIEVDGLPLTRLDPWLDEPLPVQGRVDAVLSLSGPLTALEVQGEVRYDDPVRGIPASEARFAGRLRFDDAGQFVTGGRLTVAALDYRTLEGFIPERSLRGVGSFDLALEGGIQDGVTIQATAEHQMPSGARSTVRLQGDLRPLDGSALLSLQVRFDSLSLDGISEGFSLGLPLGGWVQGDLSVQGPLESLRIEGPLEVPGGRLDLVASANVRDPRATGASLRIETEELRLDGWIPNAPEGAVLRGTLEGADLAWQGEGFAGVSGAFEIHLAPSAWGDWNLERLDLEATANEGVLRLEAFELASSLGQIEGSGSIGLSSEIDVLSEAERKITLRFDASDLAPLNLSGAVLGTAELRGHLDALDVRLTLAGESLVREGVSALGLSAEASGWIRTDAAGSGGVRVDGVGVRVEADSVAFGRFEFEAIEVQGRDLDLLGGLVVVELHRSDLERYALEGLVALDEPRTGAGTFRLDAVRLDLDSVIWVLQAPANIAWSDRRFTMDPLEIGRDAEVPVRIRVDGFVDLDGALDVRLEGLGVDLERVSGILQLDPAPSGTMDLSMVVGGNAASPQLRGTIDLRNPQYIGSRFSHLVGSFEVTNRRLDADLEVSDNGRRVFVSELRYPIDLALGDVPDRFPAEPVELLLKVDSLPAANLLSFIAALEGVEGVFDGEIQINGVHGSLRPSGSMRLVGGGLTLPEIGIAPEGIEATFTLLPDSRVQVEGTGRSRGLARLDGILDLSTPADPAFDLRIRADGFQAVERRDLEARVTGEVTLNGRYQEPVVGGRIFVERGNLFLEELVRTSEVVDLTLTFGLADLTEALDDPLRAVTDAAFNPFLEGLRVDVELSMQRDVWLRSREMNVEMAGDLIVTFDRPKREILLVGSVNAVRGNYSAFGRPFQVRSGTVDFIGAPGINPIMNIEAVHRLRQQGGQPLDIIASLEGTLLAPRIRLTSLGDPPIAESDLISYLIFGRPAYLLGSGETSVLQGATGALVSGATGLLASQLSAVVGQQIGLDFFAITQAQEGADLGADAGLTRGLVDTQVEIGQYVTQNIFLGIVLRPLRGIDGAQSLPGARMEWRFADQWSFTAYVEDRLGRDGVAFGNLGVRTNRIFGLDLFREWGY